MSLPKHARVVGFHDWKPFAFTAIVLSFFLVNGVRGQDDDAAAKQTGRQLQKERDTNDKRELPAIDAERTDELYAFVDQHHPELRRMLNWLEKNRSRQYRRAILGLDRSVRRLDNIRNPERLALRTREWELRSQIDVIAVRRAIPRSAPDTSTATQSSSTDDELESLLGELVDVDRQLLELDQRQLKSRLDMVEQKLARLKGDRDEMIQKRIDAIESSSRKMRERVTTDAKRAVGEKRQ